MDEPTNHLDLFSKEVLLDALKSFEGTVVFVSHDRYFVNGLANRVIEVEGGGLENYYGDYEYYLEKKEGLGVAGSGIDRSTVAATGQSSTSGRISCSGAPACRGEGRAQAWPGGRKTAQARGRQTPETAGRDREGDRPHRVRDHPPGGRDGATPVSSTTWNGARPAASATPH